MLKNYFKVALRNLLRQKSYSLINIFGLAFGVAVCLMVLLFVKDELSYDQFHDKSARIFRLATGVLEESGDIAYLAKTPSQWPIQMKNEFPEVEEYVRFYHYRSDILISYQDQEKKFYESNFYWADASVLDIFSFPLLQGDPQSALTDPNSVIISESMARKYFAAEDAVGKSLTYANQGTVFELQITGVMRDVPSNSHFHPEFIGSMSTFKPGTWLWKYDLPTSWDNSFYVSYVLLSADYEYRATEQKMPAFLKKHLGEKSKEFFPLLQPLTDIHLRSNLTGEFEPTSNILYLYMLACVALLILLVACINYMNLATARSIRRAREVGLRKTLGSNRTQLLQQFYGESLLMTLFAVILAFALVEMVMPWFNPLVGKSLSTFSLLSGFDILIIASFIIGITLVAGSYPALYLSGFQPAAVFKRTAAGGRKAASLRKFLVIVQFATAVFLVIATLIVSQQFEFFNQGRWSKEADRIITIPLRGSDAAKNFMAYKNEIMNQANVIGVTTSSYTPFTQHKFGTFRIPEILQDGAKFECDYFVTDNDFPTVFELEIVSGRHFSPQADTAPPDGKEFIINESAVKALDLTNETAPGITLDHYFWEESGTIVGVVKDFHYRSKHEAIRPLVIKANPKFVRFLSVRVKAADFRRTLDNLHEKWTAIIPNSPFVYTFLDKDLEHLYQAEETIGKILRYYSIIAIAISCLGLFGLAAFAAEQRTKEIGVRKILGATIPDIILLLSTEIVKLISIASLFAWPLAYAIMTKWLQDFAYHINIGPLPFLLAGGMVLGIALITIAYQVMRAAMANPVKALRYE